MNRKDVNLFKTRLRAKGQITLPGKIREMLELSEGDDLLFYVDEKGRVVIERGRVIPPDQAWFWTERWQRIEGEAQADIDSDRVHRYADIDEAIEALERKANARDRNH